ncbi:hypothetical protein PoB_005516100 [Plakobranchus ocellatus]|uniref:Uncharacterized protein n=1 Tax=Plakobranchus ocellatus TaxID=259542 RepID=A0AAV4C7G8_9GAST|nr:hypothetical protein PoB_005516100 [Plakobranchus ocellatus]
MASDSAQGRDETKIRQTSKVPVFDYRDFHTRLKKQAVKLWRWIRDFRDWKSEVSQYNALNQLGDKKPCLSHIACPRFSTGSEEIKYKTVFGMQEINVKILLADCCGEKAETTW